MSNNNADRAAIAVATTIARQQVASTLAETNARYNRERNIHTVSSSNDERAAKKEQYIQELRHQNEMKHELELGELQAHRLKAAREGNEELVKSFSDQIRKHSMSGPKEIGFDWDERAKNFSSTFEEIATNFSDLDRGSQKAEIERTKNLLEMIKNSNTEHKDFLLEQGQEILDSAQAEYNKRANIAARAMEKSAELAEQYMDISSLYAGFVDHNPVMMALWRIGGDFIKRWRTQKKAQREAIARDEKNDEDAKKLNIKNQIEAEQQARRAEEIDSLKMSNMEKDKETSEVMKQNRAGAKKKPVFVDADQGGDAPIDMSEFFNGIKSDDGGDSPLPADFMREVFGDTDEDGDPTTFSIDDSEPVQVAVAEDSPEQKAEQMFVRQDAEQAHRETKEYQMEDVNRQEQIFEKLVDIEHAIKHGHKLSLKDKKDNSGLLGMLGSTLGRFLGPIAGGLAAVLSAVGLSGMADKLTGSLGNTTGAKGAGKGAGGAKKPGMFKRLGGALKSPVGMLGRLGAVGMAGAAGWQAGTYLNDHVLPEGFKRGLGDFLGLGVDNVMSFFGNEDAERRLRLYEEVEGRSASTLGLTKLDKPKKGGTFVKDDSNGNQVVINADKIESTKIIRGQPSYEVPVQERTQERMQMLERKVSEVEEAKVEADRRAAAAIAVPVTPSTQKVVQSAPAQTPGPAQRSARNNDSSISRNTDRMVSYGMG